ncbi:MAG: hypothetical protein AAF092_07920 [Pseudomonadota bacterium]
MFEILLVFAGIAGAGAVVDYVDADSSDEDSDGRTRSEEDSDGVTQTGTDGADTLIGTDAGDDLSGGAGDDVVRGEGGDDLLVGGAGDDMLLGGPGDDELIDDVALDTTSFVLGDAGDDVIVAAALDARAFGGDGDDHLTVSGSETVTADGGDGDDEIHVTAEDAAPVYAYGGQGDDVISVTSPDYSTAPSFLTQLFGVIDGGPGDDYIEFVSGDDALTHIFGHSGDDTIVMDMGAIAAGGHGEDTFVIVDGNIGNGQQITDFDPYRDTLVIDIESLTKNFLGTYHGATLEEAAERYMDTIGVYESNGTYELRTVDPVDYGLLHIVEITVTRGEFTADMIQFINPPPW